MENKEFVAKIVKEDDGQYYIIDQDGTKSEALQVTTAGDAFILTPNASNRKWFNVVRTNAAIEKDGFCGLTYKPTRTIGPIGNKLPNEKLISYLSEEEQAEYKAIIARAIEAREANKTKPLTEKEKLEAKIAKAKAALEKLMAQQADVE